MSSFSIYSASSFASRVSFLIFSNSPALIISPFTIQLPHKFPLPLINISFSFLGQMLDRIFPAHCLIFCLMLFIIHKLHRSSGLCILCAFSTDYVLLSAYPDYLSTLCITCCPHTLRCMYNSCSCPHLSTIGPIFPVIIHFILSIIPRKVNFIPCS